MRSTAQLSNCSHSPRLDTELLLMHILQCNRAWLYAHNDYTLTAAQLQSFNTMVQQRQSGLPIAYLTGYKDFWSMQLQVNTHTLIPRPETELLVDVALELLANKRNARILELGTGSGAISLALAKEHPLWRIDAIDISAKALEVARSNAHRQSITSIEFIQSDWFESLNENLTYDAIISNPPYIEQGDPHLITEDIRFEPSLALVSGKDGLDAIRHIIEQASPYLKPNGWLLFEHGYNQASTIQNILQQHGFHNHFNKKDIFDKDRVSGAQSK